MVYTPGHWNRKKASVMLYQIAWTYFYVREREVLVRKPKNLSLTNTNNPKFLKKNLPLSSEHKFSKWMRTEDWRGHSKKSMLWFVDLLKLIFSSLHGSIMILIIFTHSNCFMISPITKIEPTPDCRPHFLFWFLIMKMRLYTEESDFKSLTTVIVQALLRSEQDWSLRRLVILRYYIMEYAELKAT